MRTYTAPHGWDHPTVCDACGDATPTMTNTYADDGLVVVLCQGCYDAAPDIYSTPLPYPMPRVTPPRGGTPTTDLCAHCDLFPVETSRRHTGTGEVVDLCGGCADSEAEYETVDGFGGDNAPIGDYDIYCYCGHSGDAHGRETGYPCSSCAEDGDVCGGWNPYSPAEHEEPLGEASGLLTDRRTE